MGAPYETIYSRCLAKLEDPTLLQLPEEDLEEMLHDYMLSAIAKHRQCDHDLSDRDDELKQFNSDLTDLEVEILAILMLLPMIASMGTGNKLDPTNLENYDPKMPQQALVAAFRKYNK